MRQTYKQTNVRFHQLLSRFQPSKASALARNAFSLGFVRVNLKAASVHSASMLGKEESHEAIGSGSSLVGLICWCLGLLDRSVPHCLQGAFAALPGPESAFVRRCDRFLQGQHKMNFSRVCFFCFLFFLVPTFISIQSTFYLAIFMSNKISKPFYN